MKFDIEKADPYNFYRSRGHSFDDVFAVHVHKTVDKILTGNMNKSLEEKWRLLDTELDKELDVLPWDDTVDGKRDSDLRLYKILLQGPTKILYATFKLEYYK